MENIFRDVEIWNVRNWKRLKLNNFFILIWNLKTVKNNERFKLQYVLKVRAKIGCFKFNFLFIFSPLLNLSVLEFLNDSYFQRSQIGGF